MDGRGLGTRSKGTRDRKRPVDVDLERTRLRYHEGCNDHWWQICVEQTYRDFVQNQLEQNRLDFVQNHLDECWCECYAHSMSTVVGTLGTVEPLTTGFLGKLRRITHSLRRRFMITMIISMRLLITSRWRPRMVIRQRTKFGRNFSKYFGTTFLN